MVAAAFSAKIGSPPEAGRRTLAEGCVICAGFSQRLIRLWRKSLRLPNLLSIHVIVPYQKKLRVIWPKIVFFFGVL